MGDTVTGFEAWRQALADTMAFAREIGCQPAVLQTLAAMVGDAQPADWRDNGAHWLHMASDAPWNQAARDAAATVPASELAKFIHMVFNTQVRLEQMQASRLALPLLKRAWPEASKLPRYVSKSRMYIGWACAIAVKAALRRKPALTDETALTQLRALQRALLHWAADDASEPDLPLKEVLAWVASHPFGMRTQAAALVERIAQAIELVPAGDAQDRKYTAHLMKSVETLRAQLAEPATPAADAVTPRAQAYPAASFHRDWDAMAKPVMQALGFERVKGGVSRWIKPVGARWLHVGFHPGKWGWTRHGGGEFFVAVELSAASDPGAVDARDGVHRSWPTRTPSSPRSWR